MVWGRRCWFTLALVSTACATQRPKRSADAVETSPAAADPAPPSGPLTVVPRRHYLKVFRSQEWDSATGWPVPISEAAFKPGTRVDLIGVTCSWDLTDLQAPRGGCQSGVRERRWGDPRIDRARACLNAHTRAPSPEELKAISEAWLRAAGDSKDPRALWIRSFHPPMLPEASLPVLAAVSLELRSMQPEMEDTGSCDGAPPESNCLPFLSETGRVIEVTDALGRGYTRSPSFPEGALFGKWKPTLYRFDVGVVVARPGDTDLFTRDPRLEVRGNHREQLARQLTALEAFPASEHSVEVRAAVLIDIAIAAIELGDPERARDALDRLRPLMDDGALHEASFTDSIETLERLVSHDWALHDPCERSPGTATSGSGSRSSRAR